MADHKQDVVSFCPECGEEYDSTFNACPHDGAELYHFQSGQRGDDPMVGETLDERFRIERVLGEGGMGKVYLATQLSVDRPVALKVLHKAVGQNQEFIKRFLREARVISGFNHPNIVRLVDFGQDNEHNLLYLVMEMLDGADLGGLLERGRLEVELGLEIAAQVCAALSEPHAHEVVHRDLKPENLMIVVTSDGSLQVKVLDFGIAQAVEGDGKLTKTGVVHGTPKYMAPEQAQGVEMTGRTDIYALGIIMFHMLVGRPPFQGDTAMQVVLQHVQSPAPHIREFLGGDDIPDSLVELVHDMIRKAPEERPASVLDVRDRIEAIQAELGAPRVRMDANQPFEEMFDAWLLQPILSATVGPKHEVSEEGEQRAAAPTAVVSATRAPAPTVATDAAAPKKSRKGLVLVLALLMLAVGGGAAALFVLPEYEYAGPGSENPEFVWPWSEDADLTALPWSGESANEAPSKKASKSK